MTSGYAAVMKQPHQRVALVALVPVASIVLNGCVVASSSDRNGGGGTFLLFVPFVLFFVIARLARSGRRRGRLSAAAPVQQAVGVNEQVLRAELSVLADDAMRLEPQVSLHPAARDDYESALHRYKVANAALGHSTDQVDLVRVQRVADEATYAMARARAIVEGRRPPEPPARLQDRGPRGEPAIQLDEGRNPVYVDSDAPFRSGWFAGSGGMFGGLLFGSVLGGHAGWIVNDAWDNNGDDSEPVDKGVDPQPGGDGHPDEFGRETPR